MPEQIRKSPEYKPLLFTTTLRNPERIKWFLNVLKNYNGQVLTNKLATRVAGEIIQQGLYKPLRLSSRIREKINNGTLLDDHEVIQILENNPQNHKEAGFDHGWPSRFDTWFKIAKQLGFVYYNIGERITFSDIGLKFADNEHPEFEQQAFLNAFAKYQTNNPFRRVLNENIPLVLLLEVIQRLNADSDYTTTGISRLELPLLLCWRDNDAEALYTKIKEIRILYGFNPSWEVILDECDQLTGGRHASQKDTTIMLELPDEFIRKMRLTGLVTLRGGGRFIDLNNKELDLIEYVVTNYSTYDKYQDDREYFDYLAQIDPKLVSGVDIKTIDIEVEKVLLQKWLEQYDWESIKSELLILGQSNKSSRDEVLRIISGPLRFEFLTALGVLARYPHIKIVPHYISDDEGLPISHAPGNNSDIECYEQETLCTLLEVTLLNGTVQAQREVLPVARHLHDKKSAFDSAVSFLIAPDIHQDTARYVKILKYDEGIDIYSLSIGEFIRWLEEKAQLYPLERSG